MLILNETVRKLTTKPENDELKVKISAGLTKFYQSVNEQFELPDGHVKLVKYIARYYINSQSVYYVNDVGTVSSVQPAIQVFDADEKLKKSLINLANNYIKQLGIELEKCRELEVKREGNDVYIGCCFCLQDVKVFVEKGVKANNFKRHLNSDHVKYEKSDEIKKIVIHEDITIKTADQPGCSKFLLNDASKTADEQSKNLSLSKSPTRPSPPKKKMALSDEKVGASSGDLQEIRKNVSLSFLINILKEKLFLLLGLKGKL